MALKHYLNSWWFKVERMTSEDKEELKILYHGLKQLTEDDRSLLMDKYLKTEGRPHPDKALAERYGLTHYQYTKQRGGIEAELDNIVHPLLKKLNDKRFQEVIESSRRYTENTSIEQQALNGMFISRLYPTEKKNRSKQK